MNVNLLPGGSALPAGDYSVWWQQVGSATTVQFDFVVVPEPAAATMFTLAAVALATTRTRGIARRR
jgi:hypothetical protein